MNLSQITPLILTYNEERNIQNTLDGLKEFSQVLIVDSFSDDGTLKITHKYPNVVVAQRKFDNFAVQCNYGLSQIKTEWTLSIDADYQVPKEFINEIKHLNPMDGCSGYENRFKYIICKKSLFNCLYPPRICLFKTAFAVYHQDGHAHRIQVDGSVEKISSFILHHDQKPLKRWIENQVVYSEQEVAHLLKKRPHELRLVDRLRKSLIFMPVLTMPYCLFFKGVLFNGMAGWKYALERSVAEMIIAMMLIEKNREMHENNRN